MLFADDFVVKGKPTESISMLYIGTLTGGD